MVAHLKAFQVGDNGTIDLREDKDEVEFRIGSRDRDEGDFGKIDTTPVGEYEASASEPYDKVKVKFDKFVTLIATHAYEEILDRHVDEDIVISTDLLADLANAHEEKNDRKMPVIFLIGIILGVGLTWILLKM